MDRYGDHAMTCKVSSGAIDKHNSLCEILLNDMKAAGVSCAGEQPSLNQTSKERPADVYVPNFDIYGEAYIDISVINILCPSYLGKSSKGPLCGAEIRYEMKLKKYEHLAQQFKPLIVECTGGWHAHSYKNIGAIAQLIASRSNQAVKIVMKRLISSLSISLQRHQGTMIVRRCAGLTY